MSTKLNKPIAGLLISSSVFFITACAGVEETERYSAAEAGNTEAQVELAMDFLEGNQVKFIAQDINRAAEWFLRAAELGNAQAQNQIGNMYLSGQGVEQDTTRAAKWHEAAAKQGIIDSKVKFGRMLIDGNGIEQDAKKGIEIMAEGVSATMDTDLEREIAQAYLEGRGVEQDIPMAVEWLEKLGRKGDSWAQFQLAKLFYNGTGIKQNMVAAEYWLRDPAGKANYPLAQYLLGTLYRDGLGVPQEYTIAFQWFERAGLQGHVKSLQELSALHQRGRGTERSLANAHKWLNIGSTITKVESDYPDDVASDVRKILETRRDEIGDMLDPRQLETSQAEAYEWWQENRSVVLNNPETLAMFYDTL
ncbi:MAG: tetratricopeptide repeat protein [Magnetovibrionaceae bacterium]